MAVRTSRRASGRRSWTRSRKWNPRSASAGSTAAACRPLSRTRIGSVTVLLRQAVTTEASSGAVSEGVLDAGRVLALVASGVLVGLSEALHGPVQRRSA